MATTALDLAADRLAVTLESGPELVTLPETRLLQLATAALVRRHGAAETLGLLRLTLGSLPEYHDTRTVFMVWAVDRLVSGGLSNAGMLWHPLLGAGSEFAWWDSAVLRSAEAARRFVPPTRLAAGDPAPCEPTNELALAG